MERVVNTVITFLVFFVLLFVYTKISGPIPLSINSVTTTKLDTFNVTSEGKVSVIPDIAVVNLGVRAEGASVKAAQDQINQVISKVSEEVKKVGVEAKDIQTANYNIQSDVEPGATTQRITGYTAYTTLTIKVRDIAKADIVIDTATANGANQVSGISFEVSDRTKAENEAREKAVSLAKSKAENAAKIAGFKLGKIINYSEGFSGSPIPMRAALESAQPTAIEPGSSEVQVVVTLSFEIL